MKINPNFVFSSRFVVVLGAGLALLFGGCQSTYKGQPAEPTPAVDAKASTPAKQLCPVAVCDFVFDVADLHADPGPMSGREGPARRIKAARRSPETPGQKAARLADLLSQTIAAELAVMKIPAARHPKDAPWPASGLVVKGQFLQVDEGNRLKRAVVGFGAGATEVVVQVEVFEVAKSPDKPILVYGTGSSSKPMPGGIVTMNPYAMAAKYVLSRTATEKEVRALGKQIAKDLAQLGTGTANQP